MVNKSFVLKENFYSRQVLTILSIPWKLPLKGYSIVVIISYFFLLFEVEHCRSQIEHGSQTSLCHNCYATLETVQETNHQLMAW